MSDSEHEEEGDFFLVFTPPEKPEPDPESSGENDPDSNSESPEQTSGNAKPQHSFNRGPEPDDLESELSNYTIQSEYLPSPPEKESDRLSQSEPAGSPPLSPNFSKASEQDVQQQPELAQHSQVSQESESQRNLDPLNLELQRLALNQTLNPAEEPPEPNDSDQLPEIPSRLIQLLRAEISQHRDFNCELESLQYVDGSQNSSSSENPEEPSCTTLLDCYEILEYGRAIDVSYVGSDGLEKAQVVRAEDVDPERVTHTNTVDLSPHAAQSDSSNEYEPPERADVPELKEPVQPKKLDVQADVSPVNKLNDKDEPACVTAEPNMNHNDIPAAPPESDDNSPENNPLHKSNFRENYIAGIQVPIDISKFGSLHNAINTIRFRLGLDPIPDINLDDCNFFTLYNNYGRNLHTEPLHLDVFGEYYDKDCKINCSKCRMPVAVSGFAMHLEVCMGIKESRTRNRRAKASSSNDSVYEDNPPSSEEDDDTDADWSNPGEKRKRKRDRNGSKRIKGQAGAEVNGHSGEQEQDDDSDDSFNIEDYLWDDDEQLYDDSDDVDVEDEQEAQRLSTPNLLN